MIKTRMRSPQSPDSASRLRTADSASVITALCIGIVLMSGAAATLMIEDIDPEIPIVLVFLACLAMFAAGVIWLYHRSFQQQLRRIERGAYYRHWRYDDVTWARYRRKVSRRQTRIYWITVLVLLASGFGFAVGRQNDGNLVGDSLLWTYVFSFSVAGAAGLVVASVIRWTVGARTRLMERLPGETYIGHEGLYITGQFWPWAGRAWRLRDITVTSGDATQICFEFDSSGGVKSICAPVPSQEDISARELLDLIKSSYD